MVNQWDTVHSDSASLEIKDGLLFEPQLKSTCGANSSFKML